LAERRDEIDERLGAVYTENDEVFNEVNRRAERGARYETAIDELQGELAVILDLSRRAAAECAAALSALEGERLSGHPGEGKSVSAALDFLDTANTALAKSGIKDVVGFLFPPLAALDAELGPAGDEAKRHLELSRSSPGARGIGGLPRLALHHAAKKG
jgi:hypothetical protein